MYLDLCSNCGPVCMNLAGIFIRDSFLSQFLSPMTRLHEH